MLRRSVVPLLAAAPALLLLWPASWFLICGDTCSVSEVRSAVGVPLPAGAVSAVPAVLVAALVGAATRVLLVPGSAPALRSVTPRGLLRLLLPLAAALVAVVLLYPVSVSSECDPGDAAGESCEVSATSLVGVPLPGAVVGTLPAALAAGTAFWLTGRATRAGRITRAARATRTGRGPFAARREGPRPGWRRGDSNP